MRGYKIFTSEYNNSVNNFLVAYYTNALDCLKHCEYTRENTYAEVECVGNYKSIDTTVICTELKIVKSMTYEEFGELLTGEIDTKHLKCTYVKGKRVGSYKRWWGNGQLKLEINYIDGKLNGSCKEWYDNGQLQLETQYVDDKLHGSYRRWWENGQLQLETTYVDDKMHGCYKKWWENGQLLGECTFVDGETHGSYKLGKLEGNW